MSGSVSKQIKSPFDTIPQSTTSSILSYVTSNDWLNFRFASRSCYQIVHGTNVANTSDTIATVDGEVNESELLWRLALVREYQFDESEEDEELLYQCIEQNEREYQFDDEDEELLHQCIEQNEYQDDAFLRTDDMFRAPNLFIAWKNWRKIDLRIHCKRNDLYVEPKMRGYALKESERVNGPYFIRACLMWKRIEEWCDDESKSGTLGGQIKQTLLPGRALDPNTIGSIRNTKTSAFKAIYSFYSGQNRPNPNDAELDNFNPCTGLFGGYHAYNMFSNTSFEKPDLGHPSGYVTIARDTMKLFRFNLCRHALELVHGERGALEQHLATPAFINGKNASFQLDSLLRWFEEHANRLQKGFLSVGKIDRFDSIVRYPTVADTANCSRAVTRGVEIVASSIYVPEMRMHIYSIRIRLLTPDDGDEYMSPEQRGFETCQLVSRYWRISTKGPRRGPRGAEPQPVVQEVRGEGVIGMYPLLFEGGFRNYVTGEDHELEEGENTDGQFSYQSCTQAESPNHSGSIQGALQFRPGSSTEPSGDLFDVQVSSFPLNPSANSYMY